MEIATRCFDETGPAAAMAATVTAVTMTTATAINFLPIAPPRIQTTSEASVAAETEEPLRVR
jgi:hypothetical protein